MIMPLIADCCRVSVDAGSSAARPDANTCVNNSLAAACTATMLFARGTRVEGGADCVTVVTVVLIDLVVLVTVVVEPPTVSSL